MNTEQLKSMLDIQFNSIVVERFDIKEIRKSVRNLRLQITEYFRNGQKQLAQIASNALRNLINEIDAHHQMVVSNMSV